MTQAFADVATIGILQERSSKDQAELAAQLAGALDTRVVIEQAKGVLAERLGISMEDGFALLRSYSRSHNLRLRDAALQVTNGELSAAELTGSHKDSSS